MGKTLKKGSYPIFKVIATISGLRDPDFRNQLPKLRPGKVLGGGGWERGEGGVTPTP